jgi:hypothetical protein
MVTTNWAVSGFRDACFSIADTDSRRRRLCCVVGGRYRWRVRRFGVLLGISGAGAGIGLVSVSPWSSNNPSAATFGALAAAWFTAVQLFASGYLAGRLSFMFLLSHSDAILRLAEVEQMT